MANKEATLLLRIKSAGEEALDRIGSAIDSVKEIALVGFAAISAVVVKSIADYREQEEATNSLSRAMINQGMYTKALKDEYLAQANAIQNLTQFGDEQVISAQAVLQGYLGQTKITKELIQATTDLAAAKKMDLASAAELVGKTIGTTTNALARNGVEVNANASKQEKLASVIAGINSKWQGQAEAAASGLGILEQLKNLFGEISEAIGGRLAPVVVLIAQHLKAFATDTQTTSMYVNAFVESLNFLAKAGIGVIGVFEAVGKVIGVEVAAAVETVSALLKGNFGQALDIQKQKVLEHGNTMVDTYNNTADRMAEIDQAFLAGKRENLDAERTMESESALMSAEAKMAERESESIRRMEHLNAQQEAEMAVISAGEDQKARAIIDANLKKENETLKNATTNKQKLESLNKIHLLNMEKMEALAEEMRVKNRGDTLNTISTLQRSSNSNLAAIGKAAAITQIAIETPVAVAKALSAFPPPFNFVAAGLVGAAMAVQAAQIAGVQLADGGIVRAQPGGINAVIGEGGQDEAVIPLDRAGEFGFGGGGGSNVTINVYGGLLGDESSARQFAIAVDKELLELRRNNESVAFDEGVV